MRFDENAQLDTSQIDDLRGSGGGGGGIGGRVAVGGGGLGVVGLILYFLLSQLGGGSGVDLGGLGGLEQGQSADTSQGTTKVEADGQMIMVKGAKYMMSAGDEPGSVGGVISGVIKSECEYLMYSFDVMLEGKNVCRMGDPLWHNKKNICG